MSDSVSEQDFADMEERIREHGGGRGLWTGIALALCLWGIVFGGILYGCG